MTSHHFPTLHFHLLFSDIVASLLRIYYSIRHLHLSLSLFLIPFVTIIICALIKESQERKRNG